MSPDRLQQSTRYGEAAPPRTVTVTPPPGGISWEALTPTSETVTASLSGPPPSRSASTLVAQTPGYFSRRGIRTDAYPAAAAGHPLLANWLAFSAGPDVSTARYDLNYCSGLYLDKICLPPGTYRGAILMRHNGADGVNTDFELPLTLVLTP